MAHSLSGTGFKILLDLVVSARRPVKLAEIPYRFRPRLHGRSKLDIVVAVEYLALVADKLVGDFVPPSYVIFGFAGSVGVLAHLAAVQLLRLIPGITLERAQLISSAIVIAINFLLNNQFTFRSARLHGKQLAIGMLVFYMACSIGLFLNLRVFDTLTGLCGAVVSGGCAGPGGRIGVELLDQLDVRVAGAAETAGARAGALPGPRGMSTSAARFRAAPISPRGWAAGPCFWDLEGV